jgi:arabinogalactan oligomer / maltooligosaccharide transport system permease protein
MSQSLARSIIAAILGLAVMLFGALSFVGQAQDNRKQDAASAQAKYQARALANLVVIARQNNADEATLKTVTTDAIATSKRDGDIVRIVLRDGKRLVFSTAPQDLASGGVPRRLNSNEKPLFDLILALPKEGSAISTTSERVVSAVPIIIDAQRVGAVEVAQTVTVAATNSVLRPAIWAAFALIIVIVSLGGLFLPFFRKWAVPAAVLAGAIVLGVSIPAGVNFFEPPLTQAVATSATASNQAADAAARAQGWTITAPGPDLTLIPKVAETGKKLDGESLRNSIYAMGSLGAFLAAFVSFGAAAATGRALKDNPTAYFYVGPALVGMLALAFFPFFYGFMLSFTDTTLLNQGASWGERWVGFANYGTILNDFKFGGEGSAFNYQNFYWTLGVTVLWTVTNVVLGVSIGLAMALLLNIKGLKGVAIYRTLLILPWAIPNYITALTWKGMFHPQFGAINQGIQAFGGQPVQWFDSFGPSFITGLATNAWLSFPFMMVVALGALQAVDEDMYEAARIDGASPWQQFWHITLPSLRPALLPAVIVSVVWTFNMFNVIYLVSAGQPSGSTEILVTRAYKIAFEEYRYGYAAAYSVVIFMILLIYGVFQIKATAATEANNK